METSDPAGIGCLTQLFVAVIIAAIVITKVMHASHNRGLRETSAHLAELVDYGELTETFADELEPFGMNNPKEVKNGIFKKDYQDYTLFLVDANVEAWQEYCESGRELLPISQVIVSVETPDIENIAILGCRDSTVKEPRGGIVSYFEFNNLSFTKEFQKKKPQHLITTELSRRYKVFSENQYPEEMWIQLIKSVEKAQGAFPEMFKPRALVITKTYLSLAYDRITEKSQLIHLMTMGKFLFEKRKEWKEMLNDKRTG